MNEAQYAEFEWAGRPLRIEYRWVGSDDGDRPLIVFLHEGLGSVSTWKDFPLRVCDAGRACGIVYSRPGYGRSTPRPHSEHWGTDFMHRQAYEVLPELLRALGIDRKPWLFGHSDGASIALLYAARFPSSVAGLVLVAPHLFVEDYGLVSIRKIRVEYLRSDLKERLSRHHDDVDSAFWGWNDIWLDPSFKAWNIEAELSSIACPVLVIQGVDDEYGTLAHVNGIARRVAGSQTLLLSECGHSPHRDRPDKVVEASARFVSEEHTGEERRHG
jgi:pimeloyl-ACP methyl ester carboxylesterase